MINDGQQAYAQNDGENGVCIGEHRDCDAQEGKGTGVCTYSFHKGGVHQCTSHADTEVFIHLELACCRDGQQEGEEIERHIRDHAQDLTGAAAGIHAKDLSQSQQTLEHTACHQGGQNGGEDAGDDVQHLSALDLSGRGRLVRRRGAVQQGDHFVIYAVDVGPNDDLILTVLDLRAQHAFELADVVQLCKAVVPQIEAQPRYTVQSGGDVAAAAQQLDDTGCKFLVVRCHRDVLLLR